MMISGRKVRSLPSMAEFPSEIGGLGGFKIALGAQDQLAELPCRAFATPRLSHAVGVLAHEGIGAGDGHPQADAADHRQVGQVVAQIGDLLIMESQLGEQFIEHHQLVFTALVQVLDAQVASAPLHHRGLAAGNDAGTHAGAHQHLDAVSVQGVEGLELAAVGQEVQTAVGEHAVHVEDRQANLAGALHQLGHHITPARSRSCMFNAPIGVWLSSSTTSALILWSSISLSASAARASAWMVLPGTVISSSMPASRTSTPRSRARRRSPSVNTPASRPSASAITVMPRPLRVISSSASRREVPRLTRGNSAPWCMMFSTFSSSRRPSAPPGWEKAKSSAVKPRASSRAMASASPSTSETVVEEVGARFSGQASWLTPASRLTAAALASGESGLPVMLIRVMPRRLISGSRVTISLVVPELDRASTTSSRVIMPMSPWLASPGCTKKAAVPVLARVAAILRPIWPDLPMPTTTTRPLQARISSQARTKSPLMRCSRVWMASSSRRMVRWADWMGLLVWLMARGSR